MKSSKAMKTNDDEEREIDLMPLVNKLWINKIFLLKVMGIGLVVGLIVAFSIPKEYTTSIILTPESQSSGMSGSMSSLASLAGININSAATADALASPDLYPDVLQSTPFLKGLFDVKVKDSDKNIDTTLYDYLTEYQSSAWWSYIPKIPSLLIDLFFSSEEDVSKVDHTGRILTSMEMQAIESLNQRLYISSNKKTTLTTIEVTMQSPEISAYLADTITAHLQNYIITYRTQKARKDLEYSAILFEESRKGYYEAQQKLAVFIDGNMNVVSAKYRITQEQLQNEANLAYSVYNQTAQQFQLAKIKVQDNTPVFTIIQPAIQPLFPSKPSKKTILIAFAFLSIVGAALWILRTDIKVILMKKD